jgi:hypothetical protein
MSAVDLFTAYQFIKRLVTPFNQWRAFKLGIIDEHGNQLKLRKDLMTLAERDAFGFLDILALNLKKLLAKIPGGQSTIGTYAAALLLLKEYPKVQNEDESLLDDLPELLENALQESGELLSEDGVPTVNAGSGQVAGIGVGPDGEPPVVQKSKYKRRNEEDTKKLLVGIQAALVRRKNP